MGSVFLRTVCPRPSLQVFSDSTGAAATNSEASAASPISTLLAVWCVALLVDEAQVGRAGHVYQGRGRCVARVGDKGCVALLVDEPQVGRVGHVY